MEHDKAVALADPMYLVMAGGDAFESRIVPESQLDDAYLLMQWASLDDIDAQQRADVLANFHDDDSWTHEQVTGSGKRIEFSINFEDGYVKVIRLPDNYRQQITEELAQRSEVMQDLYEEVGDRHWSVLICDPKKVLKAIASLEARLEQRDKMYDTLNRYCGQAERQRDDSHEKLEQSEARVRELEKDALWKTAVAEISDGGMGSVYKKLLTDRVEQLYAAISKESGEC